MMDNEGGREKKSKPKSKSVSKARRLDNSREDFENSTSNRNDTEMEEMWDIIAGDSEDDQAGQRTIEGLINDTGVDPHDRSFPDDVIHNASQAEEGEEDDEINNLFKSKKKENKGFERSLEETTMIVEQFLAKFEVAAEEDAEFNWQSTAINKLKMLPLQTRVLSN